MLVKHKKLFMVLSLSLLCIVGCIGIAKITSKYSEGQSPIRGLQITIAVHQREELFTRLRTFAEKHDFEFHLDFYDGDKKIFLVAMYREDIKILAVDVTNAPTVIELDFYERDPANPTPTDTVDALFGDLKSFISEIPNVTISEK